MISIKDILDHITYKTFVGDENSKVESVITLDVNNVYPKALMWVNDKNIEKAEKLAVGTLICSDKINQKPQAGVNLIVVDNPRDTFRIVLNKFFSPEPPTGISASASIHSSVQYGFRIFVGEHVVIEEGCIFGNNCFIGHNSVIHKNTVAGNNVKIGANCTIGGAGFGYEKDLDGEYTLIPHIGNVVLKDNVEIGNNTCIDRAVLGSTILSANVKVDNLVHIAHGVYIDENSLIIANAMIAGSATIGRNVWVAPSVSIINKISIGDNSLVGLGAVVVKNVPASTVVFGNPAKPLERK